MTNIGTKGKRKLYGKRSRPPNSGQIKRFCSIDSLITLQAFDDFNSGGEVVFVNSNNVIVEGTRRIGAFL